jgi:hypothetical protein
MRFVVTQNGRSGASTLHAAPDTVRNRRGDRRGWRNVSDRSGWNDPQTTGAAAHRFRTSSGSPARHYFRGTIPVSG